MTTIEQIELIVIVIVKWFAMFEGVKHRDDVSSLHSNRDLLDHVGSDEQIPQHLDKPSAQLRHRLLGPWAKHV